MSTVVRPLAFMMAGLACNHALGQEAANHERPSLHGAAMRTITQTHAPAEPPLRLYLESRPGQRLGSPSGLPERAPRIGLEFNLAPAPTLGVAHGTLLRTKLSEGTHLSLRVRRHGVGVMLRSEF